MISSVIYKLQNILQPSMYSGIDFIVEDLQEVTERIYDTTFLKQHDKELLMDLLEQTFLELSYDAADDAKATIRQMIDELQSMQSIPDVYMSNSAKINECYEAIIASIKDLDSTSVSKRINDRQRYIENEAALNDLSEQFVE